MRLLIVLLCMVYSCQSPSVKPSEKILPKENILDSIRNKTNTAVILFHHQVQKMSLASKTINNRKEIDFLFQYVGEVNESKNCLVGGRYNYFGQIDFYTDSSHNNKIAEMHFVIDGDCTGFYLQANDYLKKFNMTSKGKAFIADLYKPYKSRLK